MDFSLILCGEKNFYRTVIKKCVRFSFVLPLRLGVPQAGGEFVVLIFLCRFT